MKILYCRLFLLSLILWFSGGGISMTSAESWKRVDASELQTGDVVVIADVTSGCAMLNSNGKGSAPSAEYVSFSQDQSQLDGDVAESVQWEVTVESDTLLFNVPGTEDYLYCLASNNGVRVGSNENNQFIWISDSDNVSSTAYYLVNIATSRYIGVYTSKDWRCYTSINNNIKNTVTAFYRKTIEGGENRVVTTLVFSDELPTKLETGTTYQLPAALIVSDNGTVAGAEIIWTSTNEEVAVVSNGQFIALKPGRATIKAEYAGDDTFLPCQLYLTLTVTADAYTSFGALQADATSASVPVTIEFSGQQVVYVSPDNAFLTDAQGNGLLIYGKSHGLNIGDKIYGTANANLTLYQGNTEITNFTADGLTIANGYVEPVTKTISELTKVNQSTLITLKEVVFDSEKNVLISGEDTIAYYDKFKIGATLLNGYSYNVTGIISLYNSIMEISPRTVDDIRSNAIVSAEPVTLAELEQRCYEGDSTACKLTFNNLLVTYQGANHTYVTDGEHAMLLFGQSGLNTGDRISGEIIGIPSLYFGTPEFNIEINNVNVTILSKGNEVPRIPVTAAELAENPRRWMNKYVVIENVRFGKSFTSDDYFRTLDFQSDSVSFKLFNLFNRNWEIDARGIYTMEGVFDVNEESIRIVPLAFTDLQKVGVVPEKGDVNNDGTIDVTDVALLIDYILNRYPQGFNKAMADMDADGEINVTDVVRVIDIIVNR